VRGGGARNDLAAFDHELVARTIVGLPVPVWVGVGHETDQSVADLVANRAERTPTACAAALVDHARASSARAEAAWSGVTDHARRRLSRVESAHERRARAIGAVARGRLDAEAHRLDGAARLLRRGGPGALAHASATVERAAGRVAADARSHLRSHTHRLDAASASLATTAPRALRDAERHVDAVAIRVRSLDPARALARGWSITRTGAGTVVRHHHEVSPGERLVTTVLGGTIASTVAATTGTDHPAPSPGAPEDHPLGHA